MKNSDAKRYIYWGFTAVCVIAVCIVFWYCIKEWDTVFAFLEKLRSIAAPIIYGFVLAYLLAPVYNRVSNSIFGYLSKKLKNKGYAKTISKSMGTIASLFVIFGVIAGLLQLIIPQVLDSLMGLRDSFPAYIQNLYAWLQKILADNAELEKIVLENLQTGIVFLGDWLGSAFTKLDINRLMEFVTGVSSSLFLILNFVKNWLIGLIVMVYILNTKDTLITQAKKIIYGCLSVYLANKVIEEVRFAHRMFGGFIIGKILDSVIIGIICFIGTSLLHIPYAMLVSVIVGVTNVIPFFGPFIGAIPSGILVLLVSPVQCVVVLLWILALQQFDGNILGPKILGNSTGLDSFWVLFSILIFGGLFGFVGMVIAVPGFAIIYDLINKAVNHSLRVKKLSVNTEDYRDLDHIDEEKKTYIK